MIEGCLLVCGVVAAFAYVIGRGVEKNAQEKKDHEKAKRWLKQEAAKTQEKMRQD